MTTIQLKLNVPYSQKESAKALGARWSYEAQTWYVPHGIDINLFKRWWPKALKAEANAMRSKHTRPVRPSCEGKKKNTKILKNNKINNLLDLQDQ